MLGFTVFIYKAVLLKYKTSPVINRDLVLTVQPNLRYCTEGFSHQKDVMELLGGGG